VLVEDGPRYVRELIEWGATFDRDANGELALAIEGAHSARRVLHAADATGRGPRQFPDRRATGSRCEGPATHRATRAVPEASGGVTAWQVQVSRRLPAGLCLRARRFG